VGKKEDKLGIRSSDTHTIMYNDVKVPKVNRIGEDGFLTRKRKTLMFNGYPEVASLYTGMDLKKLY
jgi:alkylation response protein AidB-like acyl-CoA dehydrogenase